VKKIGVVGLGKLGLPLAAMLADTGYETVGFDVNLEHVQNLVDNRSTSIEPELDLTLERNRSRLQFTSKMKDLADCQIFYLIVPTPSKNDFEFSNVFLKDSITNLLKVLQGISDPKTIVIVSTVMPGSCREIFIPLIREWERSQNLSERTISIVYSPEFIALGSVIRNLRNPDMILVGCEETNEATPHLEVMKMMVSNTKHFQVLSLEEAELVKLLVNCFVTMKISFANFIGELAGAFSNIDRLRVAEALGLDSRIGSKYLKPGLGFAGPCFPRDNKALIALSKRMNLSADLAIATEVINSRQPESVCQRLTNEFSNVKKVGILGITYKRNTFVYEESQTLKIAELMVSKGYKVVLFDPLIKSLPSKNYECADSIGELQSCDVVVVPSEFKQIMTESRITFPYLLEV